MYGRTLEREDIVLLQVLLRDSRASPEQISEVTGLKAALIPEMIARMREAGVIGDMTAKPSLSSLKAGSVMVMGRSRLGSLAHAQRSLEANENVAWIAVASGGTVYIALHLRDLSGMEAEVRKAASQAMIAQPKALVRDLFDPGIGIRDLALDDIRVLREMYRDANMTLEEVSKRTKLGLDEVTGRFKRMSSAGTLDFSVDFFPDRCDNLLTMLHLEVLDTRGLSNSIGWLMEVNAPYLLFFNTYSNHPRTVTCMALPETMSGLRSILRTFEETGAFAHVEADLLIKSSIRSTWRDRMIQG